MTRPDIITFARSIAGGRIEPPTPMWQATLRCFYGLPLSDADLECLHIATGRTHFPGTPFRELWCRVGRRGRKSGTAALIACYEAMFGGHDRHLLPGELGLATVTSKDLGGATVVQRLACTFLDAAGIGWKKIRIGSVDCVQLDGSPIVIACIACSAEAPRGFAIPVVICDEIAHWATSDRYSNPDSEILAALRPAMTQFPNSKLVAISTPLGPVGRHYEVCEQALGNNEEPDVLAVQGATWVWSPGVTEAIVRKTERDERYIRREYEAIPSASSGLAFNIEHVQAAQALELEDGSELHVPIVVLDPGHGPSDFALAVVGYAASPSRLPDGRQWIERWTSEHGRIGVDVGTGNWWPLQDDESCPPVLVVHECRPLGHELFDRAGSSGVIREIARTARRYRTRHVWSDQHDSTWLAAEMQREGLRFQSLSITAPLKQQAVRRLRRLLADETVLLPRNAKLREQFLQYRETITESGNVRYSGKSSGPDDLVAVLITATAAELEGGLPRSPLAKLKGKHTVHYPDASLNS